MRLSPGSQRLPAGSDIESRALPFCFQSAVKRSCPRPKSCLLLDSPPATGLPLFTLIRLLATKGAPLPPPCPRLSTPPPTTRRLPRVSKALSARHSRHWKSMDHKTPSPPLRTFLPSPPTAPHRQPTARRRPRGTSNPRHCRTRSTRGTFRRHILWGNRGSTPPHVTALSFSTPSPASSAPPRRPKTPQLTLAPPPSLYTQPPLLPLPESSMTPPGMALPQEDAPQPPLRSTSGRLFAPVPGPSTTPSSPSPNVDGPPSASVPSPEIEAPPSPESPPDRLPDPPTPH